MVNQPSPIKMIKSVQGQTTVSKTSHNQNRKFKAQQTKARYSEITYQKGDAHQKYGIVIALERAILTTLENTSRKPPKIEKNPTRPRIVLSELANNIPVKYFNSRVSPSLS